MPNVSTSNNPIQSSIKPPVTSVRCGGWIRGNLFNSWYSSILTIVVLLILWKTVIPFINWAFIESLWFSTGKECQSSDGACWSVVTSNIRFVLFGFYPYDLHWRPGLAIVLLVTLLIISQYRRFWSKSLAYCWFTGLVIMGILLKGGIFGLTSVESTQWGGLPLTLLLSVFGLTAAYPLASHWPLGGNQICRPSSPSVSFILN